MASVGMFVNDPLPGMGDLTQTFPEGNSTIPLIMLALSILQQCLAYSILQRLKKLFVRDLY